MEYGTQTNEELLAQLKSTAEEIVSRLANYDGVEFNDTPDIVNEGLGFASRAQRLLYANFVRVSARKKRLETNATL